MASVEPDRSGNVTVLQGRERLLERKFRIEGFGGWLQFKFLFAGQNALSENRIYAVNQSQNGQLLSYGDDGGPGNVSAPVTVGFDDWLDFRYLFAGRNIAGQNRIYAVPA
jgi:hypothetical protein